MTCASCGRANREGARFCGGCGGVLAPRCPACGAETEPGARFCDGCGTPLAARPADDGVARKTVTIVFADLIGSTALHERLDPESVSRLMDRYHRAVRAPVEAHGGSVVQLLGDGVMCAFGVPRVAEDDAIRAVRAAVDVQRAFREFASAERELAGVLGLRVAVNTGEVVVSDEHAAGIGDPLNVAARLQQEAHDGDVLIGEETQRLVRERVTLAPVGRFALKGRAGAVTAYRVVSLERPAGAAAIAFVGREEELHRITSVYEAAVAAPAARLAVVLGSPGLGKSRLLAEFARRLGDRASVLTAQCNAAGGASFAPLAEALRAHLRIEDGAGGDALRAAIDASVPGDDAERARIAAGIGALLAGTPAPPEETFFVVRRLLAALAAAQPVVLAIDDLQWAEPLLLDLTEHLVVWGAGVPLLVLAAARPELRDTRSSLTSPGAVVSDVVTLAGLDAGAATRLAANVIGADALPAAVAGRVLATSEGNPLFLGELVRMLVHDGALKREGERWIAGTELAALEMPPTIQALLAARIERLRPEDRLVLERASVVGRHFSRAAVAHLLPGDAHADLDAHLESLRRSELIEADTGWFLGEPALRFHHVLIRDAAYRRLLRNTRAELHGRFAGWVETRAGEAVEHDETIGWHLEQAHQHLCELGPIDAQGRALGERAARYLAAAGRRALARDDVPLAASLLGRALARLDAADSARAELALDWCEALLSAGDVGAAAGAIDELGRFTSGADRLRAWHTCFAGQLAALTDPQTLRATADAVAAAAEALAALGDAAGEAKAHSVHAGALARLGKVGACEAALDRALAAARRAHDRRRANAVLAGAPQAALWGPSPVTRASGRCLDVVRVLRITQGAPAVEAVALSCQGVLEALRGRTDAARRMVASSRQMVEELGITHRLLDADVFAGRIALLEGNAGAAERCLRSAYDGLRGLGLGIDAARAAALLARALLALDRAADAEALSHDSEALAGDDLQAAIAWRGVRAEALARRGEHAAAVEFAGKAVEIAAATDALLDHADARLALAAALRAAGRSAEADAEEAHAIELWEAKGATLLAERARRSDRRTLPLDRAPDAGAGSARPGRRRVRPNAATADAARFEAAIAARDADALAVHVADSGEVIDHTTGARYDRQSSLRTWRSLVKAPDGTYRLEPLATLGDSLALCRQWASASGLATAKLDVGAFESESILLVEVEAHGRRRRTEIFAANRLGDAVVRLYERHAELLPDGPAHDRAAATARSCAAMLGGFVDPSRSAAAFAPAAVYVDQRILGFGSVHGAEAILRGISSILEVAEDPTRRVDDILELRSDALLVRATNLGTGRASGGAYEKPYRQLLLFGADGLVSRWEDFDAAQGAEALARFDELTAEPPALRPVPRRVRANAATTLAAREDAAFAALDGDALAVLYTDDLEVVDHPNGATVGPKEYVTSIRQFLGAQDLTRRHEPLATLGDALALCRMSLSASGIARGHFDVGAYEGEKVVLFEVDAQGRCRRKEVFASDHMGDAVARLCERYAELLPDGPERTRATATARSVALLLETFEPDRWAAVLAPTIEFCDFRTVGLGPVHGRDALMPAVRALSELAADLSYRVDDILALRSDALLVSWTNFGTDRASGGRFERNLCLLWHFGADGLVTRWEQSEPDRVAEALARFDELAAEPPRPIRRRVRPNAATANAARVEAAIAARDLETWGSLFSDDLEVVHHATGATFGRQGALARVRSLLNARDPTHRLEPLASLGDSLALCRRSTSASGFAGRTFDVGAYELEDILLIEVDAQGRRQRGEFFASDHLGDAIARLYERYAELLPEGPERTRVAATARSIATSSLVGGEPDLERLRTALAPDLEHVDRRTVGLGYTRGAEAFLRAVDVLRQLSDGLTLRVDDVLDLRADAVLMRVMTSGTDRASGGAFERPFFLLLAFGADGLVARWEQLDVDRDAEALASFDALAAEPPAPRRVLRRVRANAATANVARLVDAVAARDVDAFLPFMTDDLESVHHPTGATYDREGALARLRSLLRAKDLTLASEPLASLGESLALSFISTSASGVSAGGFDVGPFESQEIGLTEADAQGRRRRHETFVVNQLGDAIARLYERYAELLPDGPARSSAAATARSVATLLGPFDPDRWATALAPAIEVLESRIVGVGSMSGVEAVLRVIRSLSELAADLSYRVDDILALRSDALLVSWTNFGTDRASGGRFERNLCTLWIFGADGLVARWEQSDASRAAEALARFDELTAEPPAAQFANAASRAMEQAWRAIEQRDWDALVALYAPEHVFDDRRPLVRTRVEGEAFFAELRRLFPAVRESSIHVIATRGDRLALHRHTLTSVSGDAGPAEFEMLNLIEVDAAGQRVALVTFDLMDLDAAYAELDARYAAGEAAPHAGTWEISQHLVRTVASRDWERVACVFTEDFVFEDHRVLGWGTRSRDETVVQWRVMVDLAPDAMLRIDHVLAINHRGALNAVHWVGTRDGGDFEIPFVNLSLLGPDGRIRRIHTYDLEQLDEARACFDALTSEPPAPRIENAATRKSDQFHAAWAARDWERYAAIFPARYRLVDRRGMVQLELDRDQYLETFRPYFEMTSSPITFEVLATRGNRLALHRWCWEGAGGDIGPSEIETVNVTEVDDAGVLVSAIVFDSDGLAAAYAELDARYAAGEGARPDPLRIPPNAATRAADRNQEAFEARDWDALGASCAPAYVLDDRRRSILLTGDRDALIASAQFAASRGTRNARTLLATAGDRLALERHYWTSGAADAPDIELETLTLREVDAEGRVVATITFDPDDRRAASAEMYERFARSDAAGNMPARGIEFMRALRDRDLDRVRALVPENFYFDDHRRTGAGRLGSADAYVAFIAALFEQSPDVLIESLYIVAAEAHGILDVGHLLGTRDGGEFESVFARIVLNQGDRLVGAELFELEDLGVARARFEALRPDLARIPPNAATRNSDRVREAFDARDLDALRALAGEKFQYEDRSRRALVNGDVEAWIASSTFLVSEAVARFSKHELLGTVGDRIALHHIAWSGASDATRFELERLRILEVDAAGKLRALILFDTDDRSAAFDEAEARFVAGEAAASGGQAPALAFSRAIARRDREAAREALAPDFVQHDRRMLLSGMYDRDRFVESMWTLRNLAPDTALERIQILAWNRHGSVSVMRSFGVLPEGGAFENVMVAVALTRGDRIQQLELFDVGDVDRALARFEELCSARISTRRDAP